MAKLASKFHTVGNRRRFTVDYSNWLSDGVTITTVTATSSSTTGTVDTISHLPGNCIQFFVNGGLLNEVFTISIQVTNTKTEVRNDTVVFTVVAP